MNVKQKGNRFERAVAALLREYGFNARRGLQYQGGQVEADVVGVPGWHLELKHVNRLNLHEALKQSQRDAKEGEIPVVVHKRDREPIYVTMPFTAWLDIIGGQR